MTQMIEEQAADRMNPPKLALDIVVTLEKSAPAFAALVRESMREQQRKQREK